MQRRKFITLLGSAAVGWPLAARAQTGKPPVIGFLHSGSLEPRRSQVAAFHRGLNEAGFVEGQNLTIEYRWAQDKYERLPALAADLIQLQVAVIVAGAEPAAHVAKEATSTIPILFTSGGDPVRLGLVASLNRPGGNVTGVTLFGLALVGKRLELLRELVPSAAVIGALVNPNGPDADTQTSELQAAAQTLGQKIHVVTASNVRDFDGAFAIINQMGAGALLVAADPLFTNERNRLVMLASRHALPAAYSYREFAAAGGLMSYGTNVGDLYRLVGMYAGRILKGAKPADLPVQQPTKFELIINMKTAKALCLEIPPKLLALADEVIE
jgi:putative tryptophan/tyrosine transport system substrate-binding protein